MLFPHLYLNSNFALTLGYLKPALNNPAQWSKLYSNLRSGSIVSGNWVKMKWKPDTTAQLIGIKVETANQNYFCLLNAINLPQVKKMYRNLLTLPDRIHHFFLLNKNKADIVTLNDLQNNINLFFCVPWVVARSKKNNWKNSMWCFQYFIGHVCSMIANSPGDITISEKI